MNLSRNIIGIILGIVFVGVGFVLLNQSEAIKQRCIEPSSGVVVEIEKDTTGDSDTYYPVIEYSTNEKTVKKEYSVGSAQSKYRIGDKVDILYNPEKVDEYIIAGDNSTNLISIMFIVVGGIVTLACIITLITAIILGIKHSK